MTWQLIIGSGGVVGIFAMLFWIGRGIGKIEIKMESMEKKIESMDRKFESRFDKIDAEIKDIRKEIAVLGSRLDRLEVRVEERTLRTHIPREVHEKVLETV